MSKWLRRLRGALGTALTWAGLWCGAGMLIGTTGLFGNLALAEYAIFGWVFARLGFITGGAFSIVLSLVERRRSFDQLSLSRVGMWGAAAGGVLMLVMRAVGEGRGGIPTWGFFIALSTLSALASLLLARRAEDRGRLAAAGEVAVTGVGGADEDLIAPPGELGQPATGAVRERDPADR